MYKLIFYSPNKNPFIFINSIELVEYVKLWVFGTKKANKNLQFKMVSYICKRKSRGKI